MQTTTTVTEADLKGSRGQRVTALRFTGDISSASKEAVVGAYRALDSTVHEQILMDFTGVEYLNSSGIALVIHVLMEANKAGQKIAICGLSKHFNKVFTMVGIPKYATLYDDEASALAGVS